MESRLISSLYRAGEVLDLNGPTGGYNLQAAFSTGWLAGRSAASMPIPGRTTGVNQGRDVIILHFDWRFVRGSFMGQVV